MGRFGMGQPIRRVEDQRFLTGTGRYTDDIVRPGQLAAIVLRSPHAHAVIDAIDISQAAQAPGVVAVLTGADLEADGIGTIPSGFRATNRDGSVMWAPPRRALATERVRFVGDPVALVLAETVNQARDAADLIEVEYRPLPAVVDAAAALAEGAAPVWQEVPGNLCFDWETGEAGPVDDALAQAAHVVRAELVNNRLAPTAMETRSAIGEYDATDGRLTLTTGTQGAHTLRDWLARHVFKLPADRIRVVAPDVGGGFGMRLFLFPEHVLVLWAARRLGRPVKWVADRSESFQSDTHGRDNLTSAELAVAADGRFLGLRVATVANLGAYLSQYGAFVPTLAGTAMLTGVYAIPAAHVRVRGALTNTTPVDAYRGAGRPEAAYVIERLADLAAAATGLAPDEIRRRNYITPEQMPYHTVLGNTYDSGDFACNLADAQARADWAGFPARRAAAAARGRLRGIGLSSYIEACGGGGPEDAWLRYDADGTVTVLIGTQSTGQGHETAYAQMVAAELGLPIERVRVRQGDTDLIPRGSGTGGSRSLPVGGASLAEAVDGVLAKARQIAAHGLGVAEAELEFTGDGFRVENSNRYRTLADLAADALDPARLPPGLSPGLEAAGRFDPPASTFPNGVHVCEVEVDPETGAVDIAAYTIVDDFGVVLNPLLLAGQVFGGAVQGIGQALVERVVYEPDSGQLITGTFMDYGLPRASDLPSFAFTTNEVPCRTNPLGVKGAGEAGTIGAAPAVINAVVDALSGFGITHIDMPATPLAVWTAIRAARGVAA